MLKLLLLIKKIHYTLLFLILECVALYSYFHSNAYNRALSIQTTSTIANHINLNVSAFSDYFKLKNQNEALATENALLHQQLNFLLQANDTTKTKNDSLIKLLLNIDPQQNILCTKVVKNTYSKQNNFITLDKGYEQGIKPNMALFNDKGIVGYTLRCSKNYTVALSVLSTSDFRTGGRLKNTDFTGSVSWDGQNYQFLHIDELPKYANIKAGDTIVTTYSNIFPENIIIGTVESFQLTSGTFYTARIKMAADMSSIRHIYATSLADQTERQELEESSTSTSTSTSTP